MLRLHDTGSVKKNVFKAMKARADLVRAVLPNMLIDADDWIIKDYRKWLDYTLSSYQLGVPCVFYTERFVNSKEDEPVTRPLPMKVRLLLSQLLGHLIKQ